MKVTAHNANGAVICQWDASPEKLAAQMFGDDLKAIDGYAVERRGIFRVSRYESGKLAGFSYMRGNVFDMTMSKRCLSAILAEGTCNSCHDNPVRYIAGALTNPVLR